jgi:hypothetical protein
MNNALFSNLLLYCTTFTTRHSVVDAQELICVPYMFFSGEQNACIEIVHSGTLEDTPSRQECLQNVGDTSQGSGQQGKLVSFSAMTITGRDLELGDHQQRELLSFLEGEFDVVTITERDMESLQPTMHLSDNIIDFYFK